MKNTIRTLTLAALFVVPVAALAQDAAEAPKTQFYDFNDMLIDGELQKPEGLFTTERGQAQFNSLLDLNRTFIPEIEEAAQEEALE